MVKKIRKGIKAYKENNIDETHSIDIVQKQHTLKSADSLESVKDSTINEISPKDESLLDPPLQEFINKDELNEICSEIEEKFFKLDNKKLYSEEEDLQSILWTSSYLSVLATINYNIVDLLSQLSFEQAQNAIKQFMFEMAMAETTSDFMKEAAQKRMNGVIAESVMGFVGGTASASVTAIGAGRSAYKDWKKDVADDLKANAKNPSDPAFSAKQDNIIEDNLKSQSDKKTNIKGQGDDDISGSIEGVNEKENWKDNKGKRSSKPKYWDSVLSNIHSASAIGNALNTAFQLIGKPVKAEMDREAADKEAARETHDVTKRQAENIAKNLQQSEERLTNLLQSLLQTIQKASEASKDINVQMFRG